MLLVLAAVVAVAILLADLAQTWSRRFVLAGVFFYPGFSPLIGSDSGPTPGVLALV